VKPVALVLLALGVLACSAPRPVSAPPAAPEAAPVPAPTPASPPKTSVHVFDESLLRGKEFLLEANASAPEPRDAVIGPLAGEGAVSKAVGALFRAADAGVLDPDSLVPRWAEYLQAWAAGFQGKVGTGTVRVGRPLKESGADLMVPFRIFGGSKEYTGWVVLVPQEESLLVSDVQVIEAAPRAGPIDPESPDQLTSRPSRR